MLTQRQNDKKASDRN